MKRIAVVSDATSADFWFPLWYNYYSRLFGDHSLHVVTYQGLRHQFYRYKLGGLIELPAQYSDVLRAKFISTWIQALLETYDCVVRCDIDEFIFPDFRIHDSLLSFIEQYNGSYMTALGFDVVQDKDEQGIDFSRPVLSVQRSLGVVNAALHKTSLTRVPVTWGAGFHGCSLSPRFGDLYLAHMKFASVAERVNWHSHMLQMSKPSGMEEKYFLDGYNRIMGHREMLVAKERDQGWSSLSDRRHRDSFLASVNYGQLYGRYDYYQGAFDISERAFTLPSELIKIF